MIKIDESAEGPDPKDGLAQVSAPAPAMSEDPPVLQVTGHPGLGTCECGSDTFVLVNELRAREVPGIRASRMYECTRCGKYRLGK